MPVQSRNLGLYGKGGLIVPFPAFLPELATQARYYPRNTVIPVVLVIPKKSCFCQEGKTHRRVDIDL